MSRTKSIFILIGFLLSTSAFGQGGETNVIVNADQGKHTISKHIYGHFAEHLGRCIYDGFYVGEGNSKIANTNGVRKDVIEALKQLKVPNLRWPGGCFADTYHWKDGVGPKADRPKMINVWWGGVTEDNSFGTHDFLNMCELIGADPYLAANVGSGSVQDLTDWVNYVNLNGASPMSDWRQKNGREKPWNVKYWGVGNEAWGCGGNMTPEHYANIYKQYATFMTDWRNSSKIFRIASGANGSDYHWTEVLMRDIPLQMVEGVALHHYSVIDWNNKGSATDFTEDQYFKTMKAAWKMEELVTQHSTIMDKYDPGKKVALVVDEWGGWYNVEEGTNSAFLFQQNTMRDAMLSGLTLNIFNNHADRVRMANLAQTVNVLQSVILTQGDKMILTPTYHVMKMYNVHQDATLLPIDFISPDYTVGDGKLPSLSISASKGEDGTINISIVNIDLSKARSVKLNLRGYDVKSVSGTILSSSKIQDYNTFNQPNKISPKDFNGAKMSKGELKVDLPPFSVVVLNLK